MKSLWLLVAILGVLAVFACGEGESRPASTTLDPDATVGATGGATIEAPIEATGEATAQATIEAPAPTATAVPEATVSADVEAARAEQPAATSTPQPTPTPEVVAEFTPVPTETPVSLPSETSQVSEYLTQGIEQVRRDEYDGAIAAFDKAIELDSGNARAYYFRGSTYVMMEDFDRGIADLETAIELDTTDAETRTALSIAHLLRGTSYTELGDYESAIAEFEKAIEIEPRNEMAQSALRLAQGYAATEIKQWDAPPPMAIDTSKDYSAIIELEKGGEIVVDLFEDGAPETVNNFVFLAQEGFYDGVTFHRVLEGFMAQTGDPTGTGGGGPGYRFGNELSPDLRHDGPGILSMANAGIRNGMGTNGSQFFITFRETHFLDGYNLDGSEKDCAAESCHPVFGRVIDGMDVVMGITLRDPGRATAPGDAIKTIRIEQE